MVELSQKMLERLWSSRCCWSICGKMVAGGGSLNEVFLILYKRRSFVQGSREGCKYKTKFLYSIGGSCVAPYALINVVQSM